MRERTTSCGRLQNKSESERQKTNRVLYCTGQQAFEAEAARFLGRVLSPHPPKQSQKKPKKRTCAFAGFGRARA